MGLEPATVAGTRRLTRLVGIPTAIVVLTVLGCLAGGIYALHLGQDVNYDQIAYHYDSAYEFLQNRLSIDAAPEGLIHAYFNPLPYVPFYLLERHLPPSTVIFLLGFVQGTNFGLVLLIAALTTGTYTMPLRAPLCAGALLVSLASPMALSEMGASTSDITTSLFVLGGMALIITDTPPRRARPGPLLTGLGAGLIGIAIGLKLTNMLYAPGVAVCCAIGWRGWGARIRAFVLAGAGGATGVLLAGGFWSYRLWIMFRSPVFPYYDAIFRSPEIDSQSWLHGMSFFDARYVPQTMLEAIALPFRWLRNGTSTAEIGFRDIRFALLVCVLAAALVFAMFVRLGLVPKRRPALLSSSQAKLLAFFVVGFVCWMIEFSIQRYLTGLELLLGPVLAICLGYMLSERILAPLMLGFGVLALMTVQPPNWGRLKPRKSWYDVQLPPALEQPGLVFLQGPISFVTPFLPSASHIVGLGAGPILRAGSGILPDRVVTATLTAKPAVPVFILADDVISPESRKVIAGYDLRLTGPCWPVQNRGNHISACALSRMEQPGSSAAVLRPGEPIAFDAALHGMPFLLPGWHMDTAWGLVGTNFDPGLAVHVDSAFGAGPVRLTFYIAGMRGIAAGAAVTLMANGHMAAIWRKPVQLASDGPFIACIPPAVLDQRRDVVLQFRYAMQEQVSMASGGQVPPIEMAIGLQSLVADRVAACEA